MKTQFHIFGAKGPFLPGPLTVTKYVKTVTNLSLLASFTFSRCFCHRNLRQEFNFLMKLFQTGLKEDRLITFTLSVRNRI